jgi:hypothetical protein
VYVCVFKNIEEGLEWRLSAVYDWMIRQDTCVFHRHVFASCTRTAIGAKLRQYSYISAMAPPTFQRMRRGKWAPSARDRVNFSRTRKSINRQRITSSFSKPFACGFSFLCLSSLQFFVSVYWSGRDRSDSDSL